MIQRWKQDSYWNLNSSPSMTTHEDGDYVLYSDHLAALAEVEGENAGLVKLTSATLARMGAAIEARVTLEEENAKLKTELDRFTDWKPSDEMILIFLDNLSNHYGVPMDSKICFWLKRIAAKVGT